MKQSYEIILDLALPEKAELEASLEQVVEKPIAQTTLKVKDLQKELLVLRLAFGKLKATALGAVAPLAAVFTRAISGMVWSATRLVKLFGQVISGLFGITGAGKITEKTVRKAGKSIHRSLAGFDRLERLNKGPSGGGTVTTQTVKPVDNKITEEAQRIVDKINAILEPLRNVDTFPIRWELARVEDQFISLAQVAGEMVGMLWNSHLAPFLVWVAEKLAPTLLQAAKQVLGFLGEGLSRAGAGFLQMLADMQPVVDFLKDVVLTLIEAVGSFFSRMRVSLETDGSALKELFVTIGAAVTQMWQVLFPVLEKIQWTFLRTFKSVSDTAFSVMQSVIRVVTGAVQVIAGLLTGNWEQVFMGMKTVCKNILNSIIGLLNILITSLGNSLNAVISLLNKLKIKIPDWVPGLGGEVFGFSIKAVKVPKIPYLAKGAVLPANQPFLAMVGDQKHGTNIEAPLATIQEAVALVMQDQVEAMMAGFNALLQENRQLRHTVEGIEVGDTVIGQAAQRYNRRQAVIWGGAV